MFHSSIPSQQKCSKAVLNPEWLGPSDKGMYSIDWEGRPLLNGKFLYIYSEESSEGTHFNTRASS